MPESTPARMPGGYPKIALLEHFGRRLEEGCEICGNPIEGKWDLIHRKPRCTAKTLEDLYRLYQLANLAVAHPACNQKAGATDLTIIECKF